MQLGFVTAILPELNLDEVLSFASAEQYDCVEVMCWPPGKAERRYAGVTHIDVTALTEETVARIAAAQDTSGVKISGLGYYPNVLTADEEEAQHYLTHLRSLIQAAQRLGIHTVNTFTGRDPAKSVDDNWPRFLQVWKPLTEFAAEHSVRIGIENCPMFFTADEWPGGKNLGVSPSIWRRMFEEIPGDNLGLNYDPSHMIWQQMDYLQPMREFADRLFHIHAKDVRLDQDRLNQVGILAHPNEYHTPKLPGMGDVDWGKFFSVLTDTGYQGPVCVEVEDRAYEGTLERRKTSLRQSRNFLRNFVCE